VFCCFVWYFSDLVILFLLSLELLAESGDLLLDGSAAFLGGEALGGVVLASSNVVLSGDALGGVLADSFVDLLVETLNIGGLEGSTELGEFENLLVGVFLLLVSDLLHPVGDVSTEDAFAEDLGVEGALGLVEAGEAVGLVGNGDTTINNTLHDSEDLGTSGGAGKTNVEDGAEGEAAFTFVVLLVTGFDVFTVSLVTVELVGDLELGEGAASEEETGGVGGGVVGETVRETEGGEFVGVGGLEDLITDDFSVDDLGDDIAVGEADDEAVLGGTVLGLVLEDHLAAGAEVSLTFTATAVLDLVTLEVSLVLDELDEGHFFFYYKEEVFSFSFC